MATKKIKTSDVKVGMFIERLKASWLSTPFMMDSFRISSQKEIDKIRHHGIEYVFIDTERGHDVKTEGERKPASPEKMFSLDIDKLSTGRNVPVDVYWKNKDGELVLLIGKGKTYLDEVKEVFTGSDIKKYLAPQSQKNLWTVYNESIEKEHDQLKDEGFSEQFLSKEKVQRYHDFMNNYYPISHMALIANTTTPFSIYEKTGETVDLFHEKGEKIYSGMKADWKESNLNALIKHEDTEAYHSYLAEKTRNSTDEEAKMAFIREDSRIIVEELSENPRSKKLLRGVKSSISDLTESILENPATFYAMTQINNYDYYTFTHSVNVATLSLALAIACGIDSKTDLADIGLGSILHDIGKSKVDNKIINKPGKLTDVEFKSVTNHVMLGYEMLKGNSEIPARAFHPLLQHHEKLSGRGYPNKLSGENIHQFGRIAAIIDIYDALTTQRSYKKAFTPFEALAILSKNENDYDTKLFNTFVSVIQKQES